MVDQVKDINLSPDEGLEDQITKAIAPLKAQLAAKEAETVQLRGQYNQAAQVALKRDADAKKLQADLNRATSYVARTEHTAVANALAAHEAAENALKARLAAAIETADGKSAAEIQVELGAIAAKKVQLQQGKDRIEEEMEAAKLAAQQRPAPQPQRQQQRPAAQQPVGDPFEAAISNLPPNQQQWMRTHKDKGYFKPGVGVDDGVLSAYHAAKKAGLDERSPQFIEYLDKAMGHDTDHAEDRFVDVKPDAQRQQRALGGSAPHNRRPVASAPVSREPEGRRADGSRAPRLSREEAVTAERLGMTHQEYYAGMQEAVRRGKMDASRLQR